MLFDLPIVNQVTLSMLMLHFKKISYIKDYLINEADISKIFAPITMGINNEGETNEFAKFQILVRMFN